MTEPVDWTPLAGATKPCPSFGPWIGSTCSDFELPCVKCKGIGQVYFFPASVRVACLCGICHTRPEYEKPWRYCGKGSNDTCFMCQGRGWVANTDGWPEAAVAAGATVFRIWWDRTKQTWWADIRFGDIMGNNKGEVGEAATREKAEHAALCRAMVAAGGTLMAAPGE